MDKESNMVKELAGRVALVTGASRGIGREIAKALAVAGAHILALGKTQGALEELDDEIRNTGGSSTLIPLDITDFDALDRLGYSINERWGKLDILIGNAAILGSISPLNHIDPNVFDNVMKVNVIANYRLIRSMDPLLRASDAGRAIFISSSAASKAYAYWGLYGASKAALELMCRSWAEEIKNITNIKVMLVNPGAMRTRMRAEAAPGEDPATLPHPSEIAPEILKMASAEWQETGKLFDFPARKIVDFC